MFANCAIGGQALSDDQLGALVQSRGLLESRLRQLIIEYVHHSNISLFVSLQATSFRQPLLSTLLANASHLALCFYDSSLFTVRECDVSFRK